MRPGWSKVTLEEVATIVGRGVTPKYAENGDFQVINQKCVRGGRVSLEQARRHDSEQRTVREDKIVQLNDILVNSTGVGTLGRTAPVRSLNGPTTVDSHLTIVRPSDAVDSRWLAYAISFAEPEIVAMAEGSTGQTELSRHRLARLELSLPTLSEQKVIAATLGALDDKAESNKRIAKLSMALARSLYGSAIADEFRTVAIGKVAEFHNRRRVPLARREREVRPGDIPYYGAAGVLDYVNEKIFCRVLVLVGEDGSVMREDGGPVLQYIWGPSWINNHAHAMTGKIISNEMLYLALDRASVRSVVTGAVQAKLSMQSLQSIQIKLPLNGQSELIERKIEVLFRLYRKCCSSVNKITKFRNFLLFQLSSGRFTFSFEGLSL